MRRMLRRAEAHSAGEALDPYQYAYLAGGGMRIAESAVVSLIERGMLSLGAARLRVIGGDQPEHPVELAVIVACPRSKPVREVIEAVRNSSEVDELARRLVSLGLVRRRRRKPTRAGRRRLADAASAGHVPAHILHGPVALIPGSARRGLLGTHPVPDALGCTLIRMGKALDDDRGQGSDAGADGGGFGGGGGGGGGGD
ncbi:TIGR04222 domain-containing membrane protein [Streptomyces sp. TBY4]|uniref:TIGR04222 domain-containing membrane protein n=1 Tax=Streptomyces sp. TBY4 TaxID=2962030 RepID=UPI0020B8DD70|nr:TIGR04222 domain-containing membrane protein [Streptomyces sp. TBY4]MCP3760746.1 TIGR04222 domain-containing membrane protein [Streptomyces sp. TBY4]